MPQAKQSSSKYEKKNKVNNIIYLQQLKVIENERKRKEIELIL